MTPEGESPLMLPANEHKQLIVIDFEYANANLPGLEFANHFVRASKRVTANWADTR
jgi:choline kinase